MGLRRPPTGETAKRRSRGLRLAALTVASMVGVGVLAVAVLAAILLSGPREIGFVRDHVATAIQERLGDDVRVDVGRAVVGLDWAVGLTVEIIDVVVADGQGATVVAIPVAEVLVDSIGLLLGDVTVRSVAVRSPQIRLTRTVDGNLQLGQDIALGLSTSPSDAIAAGARGEDGGFPQLANALRALEHLLGVSLDRATRTGIRDANITNATIVVWDAANQRERRFINTDVTVALDPDSGALTARVATIGHAGRWTASLERVENDTGGRSLSAAFSEIALADIFPELVLEETSVSSDVPLYGNATIGFTAGGELNSAAVQVDVGAGFFSTGESHETILLDEATLRLRWDLAEREIVVEPSAIHVGDTGGTATGWIRPLGEPDGSRFAFALESHDTVLAPRDSDGPPLRVGRLAVVGAFDFATSELVIEELAIQTPEGSLALVGTIGFAEESSSLGLAATLSPMPVATFKQMWVPFIAPGARRWVMDNITTGRIAAGQFEAVVPAGMLAAAARSPMPDEALRLDLRLEDVAFRTIGTVPLVSDVTANVVLAGRTLGVDIESARLDTPSHGRLAVEAGAFAIDDVFGPAPIGVVEARLAGSADALGALADSDPLWVLRERGVAPADLSGDATVTISLRLPLEKNAEELGDAMDWKVVVIGDGLGSVRPVEGRIFSDADVTISVTRDTVDVTGSAVIDGVRADVSMSQPLDGDGGARGRGQQLARLSLDKAAREKLGLNLEDIVDGTVGAQISGLTDGDGQHYDLDLTPVRLTVPGVGWTKEAGVPATLSFDLIPVDGGQVVENIVLAGDAFGFSGTALLSNDDGLISADLDTFALQPGDSLSLEVTATGNGYAIDVRGASFDARGLITDATENDTGGAMPDLSITAEIERVVGFNNEVLRDVRGRFVSTGGAPSDVALGATLAGTKLSAAFVETSAEASVRARAEDAGSILRFLDVYTRVGGGRLDFRAARFGPVGPLDGRLLVDDFVILDEPAVQKVIAAGSARHAIDPTRLHFDNMVARFQLTDETIIIDEATLRGQSVGATFSGLVDLLRSQVGINGTYLPAYAINNAFSRVPVFGRVLGGGDSEGGLIGVTFRVEGSTDAPRVLFNPLSAVAPGIFRKIFEFR